VKTLAARVVEAIAAWPAGGAGSGPAGQRLAAAGFDSSLAGAAGALVGSAAGSAAGSTAAAQVVFAQYGGILASSASVLVLTRQWILPGSGAAAVVGGTTVDVRLVRSASGWRVTELHPADPGAPVASLSSAATRVLAEPRIDLPAAAVADIHAGRIHDSVLTTLLTLASTYRIGVSILRSGHPLLVFGTSRASDHPAGRAVDTWTIDGHAVVAPATPRSLVTAYMRAMADLGSYNVGGPVQLGGSAFFTDNTHHDHVHAGFRT